MLKKPIVLSLLVLTGAAYFSAYSDLGTHFMLKSAVILPIQVGACCWLLFAVWSGRIKQSAGAQRLEKLRSKL